jgi:hypothetical protein
MKEQVAVFYPEDRGSRFLPNISTYLPTYAASYPRISLFPFLLPWETQISQLLELFYLILLREHFN